MPQTKIEPTYDWAVRIDNELKTPVTMLALQTKTEIRKIVSKAVHDYLAHKAGEFYGI